MQRKENIEKNRLELIRSYKEINDSAKQDFDQLAHVATILCDVPFVLISFIDDCNQYFLAHYGLDLANVPKEESFCQYLMEEESESLIVEDALQDPRFSKSTLVTREPHIRFYAGFTLNNEEGFKLGSFCLLDSKPRVLTDQQLEGMRCLVNQTVQIFNLQKKSYDLEESRKSSQQQAERFSTIIDASNIGTWEWDISTGEVFINSKLASIFGFSLDEIQPGTIDFFRNRIHPEDLKQLDKILCHSLEASNSFYTSEFRIKHKKGHWIWILDRGRVVKRDAQNKPLLMFGTQTDITETKLATLDLERINKRLRVAQKIAKLGYWELNRSRECFFWSAQIFQIWEIAESNQKSFDLDQLLKTVQKTDQKALKNWLFETEDNDVSSIEFRVKLGTTKKWILGRKTAEAKNGKLLEGIFQDITAFKVLKFSLEASEKRYSDLFRIMPIPSWVYNLETLQIKDVNNAAIKAYGYTKEEFLNLSIKDLRPLEEVPKLLDVVAHTKQNINDYKVAFYTHKHKDDSEFKVQVHSSQLIRNNQAARVVMAVNTSETYKYITEIEEQNATLQEIARVQSHVVRAPLAKLMGLITVIKEGVDLSAADTSFFFDELLASADELDNVIRAISEKASQFAIIQEA